MVSELEINARFAALVNQRDNALNTVVMQAGEIAALKTEVEALKRINELQDSFRFADQVEVQAP